MAILKRLSFFQRCFYVRNIFTDSSWHQQMKILVKENKIRGMSEHFSLEGDEVIYFFNALSFGITGAPDCTRRQNFPGEGPRTPQWEGATPSHTLPHVGSADKRRCAAPFSGPAQFKSQPGDYFLSYNPEIKQFIRNQPIIQSTKYKRRAASPGEALLTWIFYTPNVMETEVILNFFYRS